MVLRVGSTACGIFVSRSHGAFRLGFAPWVKKGTAFWINEIGLSKWDLGKRLSDVSDAMKIEKTEPKKIMKIICPGYIDPKQFEITSEVDRHALVDECFDYAHELRKSGHFTRGEARQKARKA